MKTDKNVYEEIHIGKPLKVVIAFGMIVSAFCVIYFLVALLNAIFNLIIKIL